MARFNCRYGVAKMMQMDKKQTALLVLTISAFGFLGYQIYALVNDDITPHNLQQRVQANAVAVPVEKNPNQSLMLVKRKPAEAAKVHLAKDAQSSSEATVKSEPQEPAETSVPAIKPIVPAPSHSVAPTLVAHHETAEGQPVTNHDIARMAIHSMSHPYHEQQPLFYKVPLAGTQKEYIRIVNAYELAKMKRQLLDEEAAIAEARHRIAKLNERTSEISGNADQGFYNLSTSNIETNEARYALSYVDNQNGQWSATLKRGKQYIEVQQGSELPDGSTVESVNQQGVVLSHHDKRFRITFDGTREMKVSSVKVEQPKQITSAKVEPVAAVHSPKFTPLPKGLVTTPQAREIAWHEASVLRDKTLKKVAEKSEPKATAKASVEKASAAKQAKAEKLESKAKPVKVEMPVSEIARKLNLRPISIRPKLHEAYATEEVLGPPEPVPTPQDIKERLQNDVDAKKSTAHPEMDMAKLSEDEQYIALVPGSHYTIQLLGTYSEGVVDNFILSNHLGPNIHQFYVYHGKKPWHMLLYGNYKTKEAANAALASLPDRLKPEGPWVRPYAEVQGDLYKRVHSS